MPKLRLNLALREYDRTKVLFDGTVQPEGIELNCIDMSVNEIFWRTLRHAEFDASECSTAGYLITRDIGHPAFVAIPVFPSRAFRHGAIYVNVNSSINKPQDLVGKRVGVHDYAMTAAVWQRGILQNEYGVPHESMEWYTGGQTEPSGGKGRFELHLQTKVKLQSLPSGKTLFSMLEVGELDVLMTPTNVLSPPLSLKNTRRLFPNYREVEREYYKKTGIFPMMHVVVIRDEIYRQNPWAAQSLFKAFARAKEICNASIEEGTLRYSLPWFLAELEEERQFFGTDPWAYGLEPNREAMETLAQYAFEQGLIKHKPEADSLFAMETLDALGS